MLFGVVECCWVSLGVVGCCEMLLDSDAVGSCWKLLVVFWMKSDVLLDAVGCCYISLHVGCC